MRKSFLLAATAALALSAGSAFAQSAPNSLGSPYYPQQQPASGQHLAIEAPATYVGRTILLSNGQTVGRITEVRGSDFYVAADPWLNVGQRVYIWPRDRLVFSGTGPTVLITTPMTREQIVALPVYTMSPAAVQHQGAPPPTAHTGLIPVPPYMGPLPRNLIGKNIYNNRNDVVGFVTDIRDDKMLVSVGQFLGHGDRIVVFPREWVQFSGQGDAVRLSTSADMTQISGLPVYAGVVREETNRTRN
jgi:hypothetical protein